IFLIKIFKISMDEKVLLEGLFEFWKQEYNTKNYGNSWRTRAYPAGDGGLILTLSNR
ncbi:hypothetical protein ACJX0J_025235, partial [Zea mays]